jgi:hypothetical protein
MSMYSYYHGLKYWKLLKENSGKQLRVRPCSFQTMQWQVVNIVEKPWNRWLVFITGSQTNIQKRNGLVLAIGDMENLHREFFHLLWIVWQTFLTWTHGYFKAQQTTSTNTGRWWRWTSGCGTILISKNFKTLRSSRKRPLSSEWKMESADVCTISLV